MHDTDEDPRSVRSRAAIRRAALEIIQEEGPGAVTHQHVASRAGVGRATVYRHWPTPQDLLFEVMNEVELPFLEPGSDAADVALHERLRSDLRTVRDNLAAPIMPTVIATIIDRAQREPAYRAHTQRLVTTAAANAAVAIEAAMQRGELRASPDAEVLTSMLLGPIVFRRLVEDRPTSDDVIDHMVETVLRPVLADPAPPERADVASRPRVRRARTG